MFETRPEMVVFVDCGARNHKSPSLLGFVEPLRLAVLEAMVLLRGFVDDEKDTNLLRQIACPIMVG